MEESQAKFRHEMDLRNEKRRLREHDLMMERERMRKLEETKKEKIIQKEEKDAKIIKNR